MPRNIVKYRVFIASPGGLDNIRETFHKTLNEYNRLEAIPRDAMFEAVGWEVTLPGVGRPQEQINDDIRTCNRAVFIVSPRQICLNQSNARGGGTNASGWERIFGASSCDVVLRTRVMLCP